MKSQRPWACRELVDFVAVEDTDTGPKTRASMIAGHPRAQEALRRSVLSKAIRCVCLEEIAVPRRWVVPARGMK